MQARSFLPSVFRSHARIIVPKRSAPQQRSPRATTNIFQTFLVVLGGLAQVYVLIIGGQAWPLDLFPGMEVGSSFADGRIHTYVPTLPELVLGLGGVAIAAFIIMIGVTVLRFLPAAQADIAMHNDEGA